MYLQGVLPLLALLPSLVAAVPADSEKKKDPPPKPCTIRSTSSGNFFDLNSLAIKLPKEEKEKDGKRSAGTKPMPESWHIKGYDYGTNFTMNICAPVVEELSDVVGVSSSAAKNVSAYYTKGGETYSMG
jgi:cation-dependent mannose-6-phosphate receptor